VCPDNLKQLIMGGGKEHNLIEDQLSHGNVCRAVMVMNVVSLFVGQVWCKAR